MNLKDVKHRVYLVPTRPSVVMGEFLGEGT